MARTIRILCNPASGSYSRPFIEAVCESARIQGAEVRVVATSSPEDLEARAGTAAAEGVDVVAVYGGDGAVNLAAGAALGTGVSLAVIPGGTANVLALELDLPTGAGELGRMLARGPVREATVGRVNEAPFMLMVGVGFDAEAVRRVNREVKRFIGKGAYFLSAMSSVLAPSPGPLDLVLDGEPRAPEWVIVSKSRLYGGGFVLAPDASVWSDAFQVVLFERADPLALAKHAAAVLAGNLARSRGVEVVAAREVEVRGPAGAPTQVDGDEFQGLPLRIRMARDRLGLVLPTTSDSREGASGQH